MLKEKGLKLDAVIELKVDGGILQKRIESRIPEAAARGEALRSDDDPEVLKRRIEAYRDQTAPLVDYYRWQGTLKSVDGMAPIEEVAAAIDRALTERAGPEAAARPTAKPAAKEPPKSRLPLRLEAAPAKAPAKAKSAPARPKPSAGKAKSTAGKAKSKPPGRPGKPAARKAAGKAAGGRSPARGKAAKRKSKR